MTRPLILINGDKPRTRRTDPHTSHVAGDMSQAGISSTKVHVMDLLHVHGWLSASALNDQYQFAASRMGWTGVALDSPRKRAGELVEDGYVEVIDEHPGLYGVPESVYALTEKGKRVITLGGKK